jgi:hypothetical protein
MVAVCAAMLAASSIEVSDQRLSSPDQWNRIFLVPQGHQTCRTERTKDCKIDGEQTNEAIS